MTRVTFSHRGTDATDSVARGKGVLTSRERETLHAARLACLIYSLTYLDFGDRLGIPVLIYSD